MKKLLLISLALIALTVLASSQKQTFYELLSEEKYDQADSAIKAWEAASPEDAELYPARFNYWINRAHKSLLALTQEPNPFGDFLVIKDSTDASPSYITEQHLWNDSLSRIGIAEIDKGIEACPYRLDFRLGKATAAEYLKDWKLVSSTITELLDKYNENSTQWLTEDNQPVGSDAGEYISDAAFDRLYTIFAEADSADRQTEINLTSKILEVFPDNFKVMNISAARAYNDGEYNLALERFKRAYALSPNDGLILFNIVTTYLNMNDTVQAVKTLNEILENPDIDEEWKTEARMMQEQLGKPQ